ncbi:MAG: AAA family ATPase, partial [Cyclobacteriaceae bacterium]|nr:AAA family ATPase [Cyclobacteriaceae bacterium]
KSSAIWERLELGPLDKIEFRFNEVDWYKKNYELDDANLSFWGARGVVGDFLDKLKAASTSSKTASVEITIEGEKEKLLFFKDLKIDGKDIKILKEQLSDSDPRVFFKQLLDLSMSGLLQDIDIIISKEELKDKFNFKYLSEGEKQLLLVLGFLELNKLDNVLFLFDEPDTHLNPLWKYEYFESIMNIVGDSSKNIQILIATHDPLVISGLEKENVIILTNEGGEIEMEPAGSDLFGKGVDAILTSELFGLNSTLDHKTLAKMLERRKLLVKKEKGKLTDEEINALDGLNKELENIDINRPFADPLYREFVMAIENLDAYKEKFLSLKQKESREDVAKNILEEIMKNNPQ